MTNQDPRFYACDSCHVCIEEICGDKGDFSCCGTNLTPLTANTSEGAQEKHLPVVEKDGSKITVRVGDILHPMSAEHSIEWIYLQTKKGSQRVSLTPDEEPVAVFMIADGDSPVAAYAYCNLHGFWKTEIA